MLGFVASVCTHRATRDSNVACCCERLHEPLGITGSGAVNFREQGTLSKYFQEARELLIRLLGSREH